MLANAPEDERPFPVEETVGGPDAGTAVSAIAGVTQAAVTSRPVSVADDGRGPLTTFSWRGWRLGKYRGSCSEER